MLCHHETIHTGTFHIKGYIMLHLSRCYHTGSKLIQLLLSSSSRWQYTLAHKHQFKVLLKERCEIDYLHRLVLTSIWSENGIINLLRSLLNFGNTRFNELQQISWSFRLRSDCGPDTHILLDWHQSTKCI